MTLPVQPCPDDGEPTSTVHHLPRPLTVAEIRDAAYTQIAIASVAYAESRIAFVRMLAAGRDHGLTIPELADASGRPVSLVLGLLYEEA